MLKIHKASAGSGKTFTLTKSYIKLLLGEKRQDGSYRLSDGINRHRSILAITFTNKATEEMKSGNSLCWPTPMERVPIAVICVRSLSVPLPTLASMRVRR